MAWRIHEHVLRGEIDNRERGRVAGRIWLAGAPEPLTLDLRGDAHPDLAGCHLAFENPQAIPMSTRPPATMQRGTAGDITAARKVRVFDIPFEEAYAMLKAGGKPPEHMANSLYLEWYSDLSGRVVVESADYHLTVSEPAWRFTAEELAERERQRSEASDAFAIEIHDDGTVIEWDEFRNEQLLRESDATNEKYRQLLEKYADHPDAEELIAHEMGWERIDEPADPERKDEIARMNEICEAALHEPEPPPDPTREGIDWVRDDEEKYVHPIQKRAKDALYALMDELKARGQFPQCDDEELGDFLGHCMILNAKLAGALGAIARGHYRPEPGFTIALLKRALEILNTALASAEPLTAKPAILPPESVNHHRTTLLTTREDILALITRLRG